MNRTNLVGLFLILGAAVGFTLGLIVADAGMAAVYGAAGAGLGIVLGAAVGSDDIDGAGRPLRRR